MNRSDNRLLSARQSRRQLVKGSVAAGLLAGGAMTRELDHSEAVEATGIGGGTTMTFAPGAADDATTAVLFRDVRIFDGIRDSLSARSHVLVRGNTITTIATAPIEPPDGATVIDGDGRVLMPGMIDAHWHTMMATIPLGDFLNADLGYINLLAGQSATATLLRGFTSVRDMAGPSFGLKRAIDEGVISGPRIWPSGAMISQTSGHGDYRQRYELPRNPSSWLSHGEDIGGGIIADGADAVLRATREQLMLGASQIKLAAGGGVASNYDPLDVTEFNEDEIRAAVGAAEDWGTYVAVHAYTPRAIQRALTAGVRCIEHGNLMDEATAEMIAAKDAWVCLQPFLDDEDAIPFPEGSVNRAKQLTMTAGTDTAYGFAIANGLRIAWGSDTLFDPALALKQGKQVAKMVRWFTPPQVLTMVTATNAELLALSGPRNPYPGRLGVVAAGALADLLLVDGNPLTDLTLLQEPEQNLLVIMKDGQIYKQAPSLASAP